MQLILSECDGIGPDSRPLNNQWLMGALSLISTRAHMLMGIRNVHQSLIHFPSNPRVNINSRKYGVYVLRFYFNFKWHFILVDDRFLHIEEEKRKSCLAIAGIKVKCGCHCVRRDMQKPVARTKL